jgi:hypothetical protein
MEEQLISFETAKLAKEKGFESKSRYYNGSGELVEVPNIPENDYRYTNNIAQRFRYEAPTQSLLQKWLRVNHDIHIEIVYWTDNTWSAQLVGDRFKWESGDDYEAFGCDTYEEALEIGLQEALKLIE